MNIFRQHRERTQAEAAARASADKATGEGSVEGSIYEKMYAQLNAHKLELKAIESLKTKALRKGEFLDDYAAYVEGILAADERVQDDVVMTIFVWALDAENLELALSIAEWALAHDIAPPPEFKRSVAAILTEELADLALADVEIISEYTDFLEAVSEIVIDKDMADPIRAKLLKALGYAKRDGHPSEALFLLKDAIALHPKIGVKRDIETLERQLKNTEDKDAKETPPVSPAPVLAPETNVTESNHVTIESGGEADGETAKPALKSAQEDESE